MEASLVFVRSDGKTQEVPLSARRYVIGRQPSCQLRVPESAVSREHAELVFDGESLMVRDLGSSNGTYLNKKRVDQQMLGAGDLLGIGSMAIVVKIDGSPGSVDAQRVRAAAIPDPEPAEPSTPDEPTRGAEPEPLSSPGGLLDDLGEDLDKELSADDAPAPSEAPSLVSSDPDDSGELDSSSVVDFDFDLLDDDDDDQPAL